MSLSEDGMIDKQLHICDLETSFKSQDFTSKSLELGDVYANERVERG